MGWNYFKAVSGWPETVDIKDIATVIGYPSLSMDQVRK